MNIVGIGQCGCNIAKCFEQYPQYKIYYINTEKMESKNFFHFERQVSHENYEGSCPDMSGFFKDIKGEVIFFMSSSGAISGSSLRILEQFSGVEVTVALIIPDLVGLGKIQKLQNRAVSGVLQEYARSGLLKKIMLISSLNVEEIIPDMTLMNKYDKINETISYTLHMINIFHNQKPVFSTKHSDLQHATISTVGIYDFEKNIDKMFFSLDNCKEVGYYISIPEKTLETDISLNKDLKEKMNSKEDVGDVSYSVYPSEYEHVLGFAVYKTFFVQE